MLRVLGFGPIGGIGGSLLGAMICAVIAGLRADTSPDAAAAIIQTGFGLLILTLMFTVPACLIVGSPVIYAFRKQLVHRPIAWAALIAFIGTWLGVVCFGWMFRSSTSPEGLKLLLIFSSSSAFCYAVTYGWRTRRRGTIA